MPKRPIPYKAIGFTAFSLILTAKAPFFTLQWFACLGLVLVSYSRFHHVRQGVPCPELLYFAPAFLAGKLAAAILTSHSIPAWDEIFWKFDANYGYLEIWLTTLDRHYDLLHKILSLVYQGLPLAGVLVYLAMPNSVEIRRKYCIASALGGTAILFYRICPAAGPHYLFGDRFPFAIPAVLSPHARFLDGALNCAPSGHVAWALVLVFFAFRYGGRRMQAGTAVYLFFTCFATLVGEHYVVDLVVAVPFAAALCGFAERRWIETSAGVVVVAAWLVALRLGWALSWPMALVWALSAATLLTPWWASKLVLTGWKHSLSPARGEIAACEL